MKNSKISPEKIIFYRKQISKLSNRGKYKEAYNLARKLNKQFPKTLMFEYMEAVYFSEDPRGISSKELERRFQITASKLKRLTQKLKGVDLKIAKSIRNEYYWFSKQPMKQYRLGEEMVSRGINGSYYSMGVGACEVAYSYALKGRFALAKRWAEKSIKAWSNFFKIDANWYNSYLFYGKALGVLGKIKEMEKALTRGSKISRIPINDKIFADVREQIANLTKEDSGKSKN